MSLDLDHRQTSTISTVKTFAVYTLKKYALNNLDALKFLPNALKLWSEKLKKWRSKDFWRYTQHNYLNLLRFSASVNSFFQLTLSLAIFSRMLGIYTNN